MKKLLIVLMVVAMASFLFVGCLPTTPETPTEPTEPTEPTAKTDTPYITGISGMSILATTTQYISADELAAPLTISGVGVSGAIIKLYVDAVYAGVANTGTGGTFDVTISAIKLTEGVRKVYVTATVPGLAESDKSTEYTFTYDKTPPKIASAVADSSDNYITVTFDEAVKTTEEYTGTGTDAEKAAWAMSALNADNWTVTATGFDAGDLSYVAMGSKVIRITSTGDLAAVGTSFSLICTGIGDSIGNKITTTAPSTYVGLVTD